MKKTRFFYGMNYFLLVLLGWLLLFRKAAEVNWERGEERKSHETVELLQEKKDTGRETAAVKEKGRTSSWLSIAITGAGVGAAYSYKQKEKAENTREFSIRVLLTDSGQQSYYHSSVTLQQNGKEYTYTPDSPEIQSDALLLKGGEEGIAVTSITRAQNPPVYYGTLEIKKTDQGLLLINELPLETYLKGVVPSEMPASYEEQALMAQAVCARTYAICQIKEKSLEEEYGADVDDSVSYQVYGNFQADEKTDKAVQETKGIIMCQNGKPVTAYYFSTSAGQTSTDEIWGADKAATYLKSVECEFDQNMPWSSWKVTIPWDTLEERAENLEGVGALKGLQVMKKSASGAVTGLKIVTERNPIELNGEYEIREFLSPAGLLITEKDGTQVKGGSLLPSAYFNLTTEVGQEVQIQGKGYGHGVGMSQNGANEMAKEGYTWQEILAYFFQNITFETVPS